MARSGPGEADLERAFWVGSEVGAKALVASSAVVGGLHAFNGSFRRNFGVSGKVASVVMPVLGFFAWGMMKDVISQSKEKWRGTKKPL